MFDDSRLDDEAALAVADATLRPLAEAGARVRREAGEAAEAIEAAVARRAGDSRPRAVVAAGPDSRLLRAVLEPWCPVPFVAWPGPSLPGWAGGLDLVVVLAPEGSDTGAASAVAEAVRRGCRVVVACPPRSLVAEHAAGRDSTVLPCASGDQLATAVVMLQLLCRLDLGPDTRAESVAQALDDVAIACSPYRDLAVNPAKILAIALADATPLVWGGSVLAARAARRVAESVRRASGRTALAGDAEHLLPVIAAAPAPDVFADPFADPSDDGEGADGGRPPWWCSTTAPTAATIREQRGRLLAAAEEHRVRVETVSSEATTDLARYAALLATGTYAAGYLGVALSPLSRSYLSPGCRRGHDCRSRGPRNRHPVAEPRPGRTAACRVVRHPVWAARRAGAGRVPRRVRGHADSPGAPVRPGGGRGGVRVGVSWSGSAPGPRQAAPGLGQVGGAARGTVRVS